MDLLQLVREVAVNPALSLSLSFSLSAVKIRTAAEASYVLEVWANWYLYSCCSQLLEISPPSQQAKASKLKLRNG